MNTREFPFLEFLNDLMRRRKCRPSRLASDMGISHITVSRWLSGVDVPGPRSCKKLAEYSGTPLESMHAMLGYLTHGSGNKSAD